MNEQKTLVDYGAKLDDFGFIAISEDEYKGLIKKETQTAENYKQRLEDVEKLVIPLLQKLFQTGDKEYIYWPNRKTILEQHIDKVLKLTRTDKG